MAIFALGWNAYASDTDGNALTVRNSVRNYLSSEGYTPSIDSDGDIKFKSEGKTFYIYIENWGGDVYLKLYSNFSIDDSYDRCTLLRAANKAQDSLKFARIYVGSDYISYEMAMCIKGTNYSQFTSDFSVYLSILNTARTRVNENYDSYKY